MRAAGLSTRKIAASLSVGQSTVAEYLKRAEGAGLSWPLPEDTTEADIERRLFAPTGGERRRGLAEPEPEVLYPKVWKFALGWGVEPLLGHAPAGAAHPGIPWSC